MTRLATGIQGFDGMVQGGLPVGSSVILQGPPGQEKLSFALTFLAEGLKAGASGLVVISSQSPDAVLAELRNLGVDLDAVTSDHRLRIVDWYSWSEESVHDIEERGIVIRSSIDLTNLGVALSRAIASISGDQPRRAVIELLSPATNVYELTQVYAFAQSAKKKFDRYGFTSLVLLEKDMHSGSEITTLHQPFDGVIEIERTRSGDRIVRKIGVLHLKDTAPDPSFRVLEIEASGMRVVREAAKPATPPPPVPAGAVLESQEERARRLTLIMQIAGERLKLNPRDTDALFAMAAAQATLDDARGGVQSLERLSELDPNYPGLWVLKTKLHARLGETDRARQSRLRAQQAERPEAPTDTTVPCPMCDAPVAADATVCANCGVKFAPTQNLEDELEDLGHAAIQEMVHEGFQEDTPPAAPRKPAVRRAPEPEPRPAPALRTDVAPPPKPAAKPTPKKGLTNGLVLGRGTGRRIGMTNGLRGRTNGLRGRTNGLTNGLRRTNGLTNGVGRTNGLTNGLGRTNGLTNGLGRTNGLTNGLGRTNGITNGLGRTNGLTNGLGGGRPSGFRSTGFRGMMRTAGWKLYVIPLVVVGLLLLPLFFVPEYHGPLTPIQIDGQFVDWATVSTASMSAGAVLNPNVDVVRFGVVDNLGPQAFYVQVAGSALQGGGTAPGTMDSARIFVDTDGSSSTGYRVDGLGADRLIEVSGYAGVVRQSTLWEFDANRDTRDWSGWIKGTAAPAAASGSQIEAEAEWLADASSIPFAATIHMASWNGQTDVGDFPISTGSGSVSVIADPQVPNVITGNGVPLLRLTLTGHGQPVSLDSLTVQIVGTAAPTAAQSLLLMNGLTVLDQVTPTTRDVRFSFPAQSIGDGSTSTLSVVGDFIAAGGDTFGVRLPTAHPFGLSAYAVGLRENPGARTLGYLGSVPGTPRLDGGFDEWSAFQTDLANDVSPRANPHIDVLGEDAQADGGSTFLYVDVTGRILHGTSVPEFAKPTPVPGPSNPADTDRDTVPDSIDPMPFDFNNDGIPDAQTNGDYDADGITDYGFPGGTDYWLNTTLPISFPAPYAGLSVSVYIGPTTQPPLLGEDVLRVFLDIDNSTGSGYAIGGIGADRLVELRGKDGGTTQSALLAFSGSFPGEWSWTPLAPVTVALGFHAVEMSVPFNATNVYVEAGDFWGSVDTTSAVPALSPVSFKVAAADTILAVPWTQVGPQPSATLIDGNSNSATTVYNHQRKVVRAGSGAGATPCDATNSAGCWYVVFYDQLALDPYDSAPGTETVTTGTKVSGTFSANVQSNNNVYINYREANTGSQTVVSNNPTAVGTTPACAWTNCASGETSNNAYTDSSTNNQVVSYKTFGFSVPSGATVNKVEFGVEAYQDSGGDDQIDTMALSWNAGTTYCSNTQTTTPATADPNAYTYFDVTSCTGHTWAQADFTGDNIAWQGSYRRFGGTSTPVHLDAMVVRVTYTPTAYALLVQYDFTSVPNGNTNTLNIEGYHSADENVNVQVLTPPSTWNSRITITATSDPGTAQTYALTSTEYNSGSPSIRFVDASGGDTTQTDLFVDLATITTTMTKTPGTETITTGTKVAGTFPSGISTADATYIQYREANTGSQTVVSNNPTAVGTTPVCAWTNCASGETSNNAYADSSLPNQVVSFKTFGFSAPTGATINKVEFGIEAYQDAGGDDAVDTMALSWNAGTTYCSNTQSTTPGTSDPNAYTYFDVTTCTGHTWAQADFTGDNIAWQGQYHKNTVTSTPIHLDAVVVRLTYTPTTYSVQVQYDWSGVPSGDVYTLNVKGYRQDEDISVQVLTPPSTWTTRLTISATSNTLYTYALTASEYSSGSPSVRFVDAGGGDTTQSDFWLDQAIIATTSYWDRIYLMRSLDTSGSTWGTPILLASGRIGGDPLLYQYDSAEPSIAIDSSGFVHVAWVSAGSTGNQQTLNRVRYTKTTVAYPTQSQLASASNWQSVTVVDDSSLGYMPTVSTDTSNNPHIAWSGSKTSGTVYYKNMFGGAWKPTVSWGSTYTGISVDVSPANNYVNIVRYYEAATNEIQYTVCKALASNNCDATSEFTKWDGTAGYDTVATSVETGAYPSLATTYEANGDLWIAYAKDVDGTTRAIYARFLDYPSNGYAAAETVDSLSGTRFTRPSIGVDNAGNVHAMYVAISGPQLYYKQRSGGSWGSRTAIDSSTDYPSVMVRAPNDATYGNTSGAVYWKSLTSETYFYYIPEFESVVPPVAAVLLVAVFIGRRARSRRKASGSLETA